MKHRDIRSLLAFAIQWLIAVPCFYIMIPIAQWLIRERRWGPAMASLVAGLLGTVIWALLGWHLIS
jgi:hypothetical protein